MTTKKQARGPKRYKCDACGTESHGRRGMLGYNPPSNWMQTIIWAGTGGPVMKTFCDQCTGALWIAVSAFAVDVWDRVKAAVNDAGVDVSAFKL